MQAKILPAKLKIVNLFVNYYPFVDWLRCRSLITI